jgi:hypothetical protein
LGVAAWYPVGLDCAGFAAWVESAGDVRPLDVGVGVIEVNPTMPFKFDPCVPETGLGAANWVLEVVLTVDVGGAMENVLDEAGAG